MARYTKGFIIGHDSCTGTYVLRSTMLYYDGVPGGDIEKELAAVAGRRKITASPLCCDQPNSTLANSRDSHWLSWSTSADEFSTVHTEYAVLDQVEMIDVVVPVAWWK